jgi:hypothetical protein
MDQLMQKLMLSKKIMDRHDDMKRGSTPNSLSERPSIQSFDVPNAKYNIPQEFLHENASQNPTSSYDGPRENTKPVGSPTIDAIKKSKLPDEIKKLMIEHPIQQASQPQTTNVLSNELIEKASRLMKEQNNNYVPESASPKSSKSISSPIQEIPNIKQLIKEAVRETLQESGILSESSENSNEIFSFKVGKHVFEGKVTKIKKLS